MYNSVVFSIFTEMCTHHQNQFLKTFLSPPKGTLHPWAVTSYFAPSPRSAGQSPVYSLCLWVCLFQTPPVSGIRQCVVLRDHRLLPSLLFSGSSTLYHALHSFLLLNYTPLPRYTCGCATFHLSIHQLGCFYFWAVMKRTAITVHAQVFK